jgi:hypothetical protein
MTFPDIRTHCPQQAQGSAGEVRRPQSLQTGDYSF